MQIINKRPKTEKQRTFNMGKFIMEGPNNMVLVNDEIRKFLTSRECSLKEAKFVIGGKTFIIKRKT